MRILRNYILTECILPFFLTLSVLTSVFLLGFLPYLANQVINKGVSLYAVSRAFVYNIPELLGYTLPIACLATVILAFGRLSADNEIIAIRASGINLWKLLKPIIIVGAVLSLVLFILNERIIPESYHMKRRVLRSTAEENPAAFLEAGTFIHNFENKILFINKIEKEKLYGVRIYEPQDDLNKPTRTVVAQEAEFSPVPGKRQIMIKLMKGSTDEPDYKNLDNFYKLNFNNSFITLDLSKESETINKKPKGMTLKELDEKIIELRKMFIDPTPLLAEYNRKIAWSFSPLIFMLLGFPLAIITHSRQKKANLIYAFLFATPYFLLLFITYAIAKEGRGPIELLIWSPNILAGIVVSILNIKLCAS